MTTYTFSELITFTRASTATYVDASGLIASAAINAPRFDYNPVTLAPKGLLIEEQRTNLFTYSEQFDNAAWTKGNATVTANATSSPDGTVNADKLVEDTATTAHNVSATISVVSGTSYAFSVYAKAGERSLLVMAAANTTTYPPRAYFDLSNGTIAANSAGTAQIQDMGNGWYRCSVSGAAGATAATSLRLGSATSTSTAVYAGDGVSGLYLWGAQLEAGSFATSYIPTVASQVTRSADVASMTAANFSSWYNQGEGTLVCEFALEGLTSGGAVSPVWIISDGTAANSTRLREGTIIAGVDVTMLTSNVVQVDTNQAAVSPNAIQKTAFAWSTVSANLAVNGTALGDSGAITPPTVNQMVLTGSNKWLRQLTFYPTRLTNAQLQSLTA